MEVRRRFGSGKQTAKMLGIDPRKVYAECDAGRIPFVQIGRRKLIPLSFVDELVAQAFANCAEAAVSGGAKGNVKGEDAA